MLRKIVAATFLLLVGLSFASAWVSKERGRSPDGATTVHDGVALMTWTDGGDEGARATIWLRIANDGEKPIRDLAYASGTFLAAKVRATGMNCLTLGGPSCEPGGSQPTALPAELHPGDAVTRLGSIEMPGASVAPSVFVEWTSDAGSRKRAFIRWPLVGSASPLPRLLSLLRETLKDFALPLILAWLGYLFQKDQKDRDLRETADREARKAADESARAERDRREADARAEREKLAGLERERRDRLERELAERGEAIRSTLLLMLPKVHENAEKWVMPLSWQIRRLRNTASQPREAVELEVYLLQLLQTRRSNRRLHEAIGGIFFKSQYGERLFTRAWDCFFDLAEKGFPEDAFSRAIDETKEREGVDPFRAELASRAASRQVLDKLREDGDWPAARAAGPLLDVCLGVLEIELHRPLDQWYPDAGFREQEGRKRVESALAALQAEAGRGGLGDSTLLELAGLAETYFAKLKPEKADAVRP